MKNSQQQVLMKLRPQLAELERKRKELREKHQSRASKIMFVMLAIILVLVCFYVLFAWDVKSLLILCGATLTVGITSIQYFKYPNIGRIRYEVGKLIMNTLQPNWKYQPELHLHGYQFVPFGLTKKFNKIRGAHLTHGRHEETNFSFSFVGLSNQGSDHETTVFEGLILIADFHKEIKGKTLVFPDVAQRALGGWLGKKIQESGWKGLELVYLEDPVFEEQFAVYGSDQVEARYILTPSMMERMTTLSKKYQNHLSFAFTKGKVCVTIDGLLPAQLSLNTTILPDGTIHHFTRPIELVKEVIDVMELNTRIWEKD